MHLELVGSWSKVEQINSIRNSKNRLKIFFQMCLFLREVSCQGFNKPFLTLLDAIGHLIFGKIEAVGAFIVHIHQFHFVHDAQILANATYIST